MRTEYITLIDGSELECFPVALRPDILKDKNGRLCLDTTGKYLHIEKCSKPLSPKEENEVYRRNTEQFYRNIHLFLANADRILSDSRLFLAPVDIPHGLAYTGDSGLRRASLGVYIEWWLYHKDASVDAKGNPIWYITGSPLSGSNACRAVDRRGNNRKAQLNGSFSAVWSSFLNVNRRYQTAKNQYMAYSLQEVIELLQGETDEQQLFRIHLRLEKASYDNYIACLKNALASARKTAFEYNAKIQRLLIDRNREKVETYYNQCLNMEMCAQHVHQEFLDRRIELRKQLRSGKISNREYQQTLSPLRKCDMDLKYEHQKFKYDGLREIFGDDMQHIDYLTVEQILTSKSDKDENNR